MSDMGFAKGLTPKKRELLHLLLQEKRQKSANGGEKAALRSIPRRTTFSPAPVSFAQQRLWFIDQLTPGIPAFNIPAAVRLRGTLDPQRLHKAFAEIIRRHETLRTSFTSQNGTPLQVIAPSVSLDIPFVDLRSVPEPERMTEIQRLITQDCQHSFDLTRPPLIRVSLVLLDEKDQVLILMMHHIVGDVWSVRLLMKELARLYEGLSAEAEASLPELPIQYADYAIWQREWLQGPVLQQELAYWKKQLAGMPEELELPFDHPRPPVQSIWGAKHFLTIPKEVADRLRALGRQHGASLFMTLLAGWKALLHRYTGQEDIVVGAPVANRNRSEYENMIGFFVNSVLLRTDLSGDPTFLQLLSRVREMVFGAFSHQDFPFERLVELLQPARNMSRNPLYQTDVILQNAPTAAYRVSGMSFEPLPVETGTAQLDMTLDLWEEAEGIGGWLEYDTDLFDASTVSRMVAHYVKLLERIVETPTLRVSEIPVLLESEERKLLVEWNDTARDYDLQSVYSELFEQQALERATEIAVFHDAEQLTYAELNQRANQIAHLLIANGVGPETVVALLAARGIDLLAAMLGVFKAGGAYMPLDPAHPTNRHQQILEQSGSPVVLCAQAFLDSLNEAISQLAKPGAPKVFVFEDLPGPPPQPLENPPVRCAPDNLAYVLFTSGSTGLPKGVMIHHRGMVNHLFANIEALGMTPRDIMAQTASQCFDISVWQFLAPLVIGGKVHIFADDVTRNPPRLLREVDKCGITVFETVPSLLQVALSETRENEAPELESLRWLLPTGEAVSAQLCRDWFQQYPGIPLMNAYGPSECSDDVTLCRMDAAPGQDCLRVSIGAPVANLQVSVLDRNLRLVPIGVAGELCVRGVGIGRGYLGQPDRTAAVFVPDPFSSEPGARMYRSGDRARYLVDGTLEFLERMDHQVKVRGFRIELGEIEAVLRAHPAVQDCVVMVRDDTSGRQLAAYMTLHQELQRGQKELQDYLQQKLPEYMVPAVFVFLERLPLTPNGKVDRKALPKPERDADAADFVPPRTPVEEVLAGLWSEILGIEKVSAEANLFELGAHSLLVTQVVSRIRTALSVEPPLRTFFESPTVAGMARVIERLKAEADGLPAPPIVPVPRNGNYPLSFTQERMWFLDQMEQDLTAYNVPGAVYMDGVLNPVALEAGFTEILRRHEIFRTTYKAVDGKPAQVIHSPQAFHLPVVDLSALKPEDRESEAMRVARGNAQRPFDLLHGPVLRVFLLRSDIRQHMLAMTTHHIAYDMWAREIFIYELGLLYEQYVKGLPSTLDEPEIQWVDYASWLRNWMQGEVLEQQLNYWRKKLAGAPPFLDLPIDLPRPPVQSYKGARQYLELPPDVVRGLKAVSRKFGVTQFITVLAAFKALLYRWTGQEHIVLGTPIANRNRVEVEKLMGFLANILVFNTDLSRDPTFVELLGRVRETALGAYAHQDLPFEFLVQDLQPERSLSRPAIFQVSFNYMLNYSAPTVNLSDLTLRLERLHSGASHFEISVDMWETEDGLNGVIEYCTDLFHHSTITQLVTRFRRLLQAVASNPDQHISDLPLLGEAERKQLLVDWNNTVTEYPRNKCVPQLFAEQATKTPQAIALEFQNQEFSYQEVNERSNQIAHYLRDMGVGPEMAVAVCLRRCPELIFVLLGILKSGGAYLPLDTSYPADRLAFMLEDTHCQVLITNRALLNQLPVAPMVTICVDEEWPAITERSIEPPPGQSEPEGLAYIIYTSGSTGRPKGVAVVHHNIVRLVRETSYASMAADEVFLLLAPVSFDASTLEIWGPLLNGARLAICPEPNPSLPELGAILKKHKVTTLWLTAGLFRLMVDEQLESLAPLRQLIAGGDVLSVPHVRRVVENLPCRMINGYGPTENTTFSCCHTVQPGDDLAGAIPIGRPIANSEAYVLDRNMQPVPVGTVGELYLGGEGLARGYFGQSALTAEKFVPHPHTTRPGARLYRTGDWARYSSNGNLEFVGRKDGQVKVRGFRIETGEIETVVGKHPGVQQVVVLAKGSGNQEKRIVAFAVPRNEAPLSISDLREYARQHLPEYMTPSGWILLDRVPLTANGKVDRNALERYDDQRPVEGEVFIAPATPIEQAVARILQELLQVDRISRETSFFDAGGHSLLAMQALARINKAFSVELPTRSFFEFPTVAGIARAVDELQSTSEAAAAPPIPRAPRDGHVPLSFTQQRMWFLDRFEPGLTAYNIPGLVYIDGQARPAALEAGLTEIVRRHEVLRTTYAPGQVEAVQVIHSSGQFALPVADLSSLRPEDREKEALRVARECSQRPFDLFRGPIFRVLLVRTDVERHLLVTTFHHIAYDMWAARVFVTELSALYEEFGQGRPSPLKELEIQWADYATWQRNWLQEEVLESQLTYWRKKLSGAPRFLDLPIDLPRPAVQSYCGARQEFHLPGELAEQIRALGRSRNVTPFITVLAAFKILLCRWTGQEHIVIGSPIANRNRLESEQLIGFLANTVVFNADLSGDPTVSEVLERVRETAFGAYAHQDMPFEYLVQDLQPDRVLSRPPIFQVSLNQQRSSPVFELNLSDVKLRPANVHNGTVQFELSADFWESEDGFRGVLEYCVDLFYPSTITRLIQQLRSVLEGMIADPEQRISELALLTEAERRRLLHEWNDTQRIYPVEAGFLHRQIQDQAVGNPEAVAVVFEQQQLTYSELNRRCNQLAWKLRELDSGPGKLVAVCMERSLEMVIALLGILKAGAAYVPLDPGYPKERLAYMMRDAEPPVLLTQHHLLGSLPQHDARVLFLDSEWQKEVAGQPDNCPEVEVHGSDLAYVIYTSGSTGKPKGAMNTHSAIRNRLMWMQEAYRLTPQDAVLQKTPFSFDVSVWEFFWPLMVGARLVVAQPGGHQDSSYLIQLIQKQRITTIHFVPSMLQIFLEHTGVESCTTLKRVICSGEALSVEVKDQFLAKLDCELHNLYGPTEAAVDVTYWQCGKNDGPRTVPIGRPIANVQMYILDRHLKPVPVGTVGRLYIGGAGLARGYWNRPSLTAEKFAPNPFSEAGERLYDTGDLGRFLPDGAIEYLGRTDHQVKIRGFRIELGEIEAALLRVNEVKETVVVVKEQNPGDRRLVAYVVPRSSDVPDEHDLREALKDHLPAYMVPSAFVVLQRLPLSPNGKLDRNALPQPEFAGTTAPTVAARTTTEETVATMWADVLGIGSVAVNQNFFELGGHSLLAMRLMTRVNEGFKVDLSLRVLFDSPTVAGLAQRIDAALTAGSQQESLAIERVRRDAPLPLSFSQENLWLFEQMSPGTSTYTTCRSGRIQGALNAPALHDTVNEIFRRHEALHTSFESRDGHPVQVVHPESRYELPVADLSGLASADREHEAIRISNEYAQRPIDLTRVPVARFCLLRLGIDEHVFILSIHHAAYDLWSGGILLAEIERAYRAFVTGLPLTDPEPAIQYADFAVWQRKVLQGEALDRQLAYWKERLAGLSTIPMEIPTDHPRPAIETSPGASVYQGFSKELSDNLKALARREGVTQFMLLLAAFKVLLHRYTRQNDIVVGSVIANRNRPEMEDTVGFFDNVIVLRSDASGGPTYREFLHRVRDVALGAYAHQHLPFEYLVKELQPDRIANRTPWIQAMFVYLLNYPAMEREVAGLKVVPYQVHSGKAMFDLLFAVRESDQGLKAELVYNCELFEQSTISRMLSQFHVLLGAIAENPEMRIGDLPLLAPAEEDRLLSQWNDTARDYPAGKGLIHEQIEDQALRHPELVAVTYGAESLTYAELNARANQLARKLRELGAAQGLLVGICMERSLEMVIGLVATLKSGAAYVPLDPGYPNERLAYMIADAQASVLLVQEKLVASLPRSDARVLAVDSDWEDQISTLNDSNLNVRIDGEDLAYVIYTSGSTGKPKAAMNTHHGVRNRLLWGQEKYQLVNSDKVLQKTPFSFDVSVWEFFWPLTSGAQLVLARPGGHQDSSYLVDLIRSQGITTVHFVPSMLQVFLEENGVEQCTTVKRVLCSGEAMSLELKERFFARFDCELHNLYGPTEASVEVTWWECRPNDDLRTVPIGRPIANTRLYILDGDMRPVPIGVPGDLYIGGAAVGRGYWRRPALTAANFVPDPFSSGGRRLYRTGDVARYRADGWIEYMGRSDHQVKIRGFRIELGEIEETLLSQNGVKDAVVLARDDNSQAKSLVAYMVLDQEAFAEGEDTSARLKAALKEKLPPYMVPSAFVYLESLPLLPNGKLDRKALPAPEFDLLPRNVYLRPRDTLELQLIAIWEEILSVQPIGVRDDFFELGGHSLKAVQLAARIRQEFGQQVPIACFLHNSTVEDLATLLRTRTTEPVRQALVPVKPRGDRRPFFCVHPVGGSVLCYAGLARHLNSAQPFYALQSNDGIEPESVEAMASQYIECVRSIQEEGPYLLGGWSMGGVVAFEMGRQLLHRGESAEVYLIDTIAPHSHLGPGIPDDALLIGYFIRDLESITGRSLSIDPASLQVLSSGAALRLAYEKARQLDIIPESAPYEELVKLFYKFRKNLRAMLTYNAEPYAGRLTLIKSSGTTHDQNDPSLGWAAFAQGALRIREIEGDHYSIVTGAQVQELACLIEQEFFTEYRAGGIPDERSGIEIGRNR